MENALDLAVSKHPRKNDKVFRYGTAGFRDVAAELDFVMYRMGLLAVLRSRSVGGKRIGVMVTASHNPERDNGVKLVDPHGEMLEASWEEIATNLVAATDAELPAFLDKIADSLPLGGAVVLGRDTRISSPSLASAVADGVCILGGDLVDLGVVTTPQLHYVVACTNTNGAYGKPSIEGYCEKLVSAFETVAGSAPRDGSKYSNSVVFDGANGVGIQAMERLLAALSDKSLLNVEFFLTPEKILNKDCGSDFVKTEQCCPVGLSPSPGKKCVSFDGDADRIIYFYVNGDGEFRLLDGDKIGTLIAGFLAEAMKAAGIHAKLGVVQTAYANGSSTHYLEKEMGVPVACAKTGVKHLHRMAEDLFDIGVYFEANGHGTVIFKDTTKAEIRRKADHDPSALKLLNFVDLINETVGDALSIFLVVEAVLMTRGWNAEDWDKCYVDLPNKLLKVSVRDRHAISTTDAERRCVTPAGLQDKIDAAVSKYPRGRSFVRPSGTEDVVRVYAEAATREEADALAEEVADLVRQLAGGF